MLKRRRNDDVCHHQINKLNGIAANLSELNMLIFLFNKILIVQVGDRFKFGQNIISTIFIIYLSYIMLHYKHLTNVFLNFEFTNYF